MRQTLVIELSYPSLGFKGLSHIYSLIRRISSPWNIAVVQKASSLGTVALVLGMREQKKRGGHFSKYYSSARILHNFLGVHHPIALRVYALTFLRYTYPRCGDR